jgi:soluble lytic murein transglycosylase-like protein
MALLASCRASTFTWLGMLLVFVAQCEKSPDPFADRTPGASSQAFSGDPELRAMREQLAPLARQLGSAEREALAEAIVSASRRHDLPQTLVLAVIAVESRFDPYAVSQKGALGLMQVLPSTGAPVARRLGIPWRGPQTLFDPSANVQIGVAYLRELVDRYANVRAALAAYNWGPGEIDARMRAGSMLPVAYPERVLDAYLLARRTDS